jgi:hypothetical protein
VEELEKDEAETSRHLVEQLHKISDTTFRDGGHGLRSVHAKSHGLLKARFEVKGDLPAALAQGLFAKPASYGAIMRFSTTPGDILADSISTPRGLAVKVIGVEGERLPGSEGAVTQDFVLVNNKTFTAPNAKAFLASLTLLAATTDKGERVKKVISAALRGAESIIEALGKESGTLKALGGQLETHILGDSFYSQAPIRFGDYVAKIAITPSSEPLKALAHKALDLNHSHDGLRDAVVEFFATQGGVWDVRAQLCTNLRDMPVEHASTAWSEDASRYLPVAQITAEPQEAWSQARSLIVDDGMAFNPWHGLAAHRPLGSIMRMRKAAYEASVAYRVEHNGTPVAEPASADVLPG